MERNVVIVQIGGEGGDLTIYGVRTHAGWRFSQEVVDQSSLMPVSYTHLTLPTSDLV